MTGLLQYRPLDLDGEEILEELEAALRTKASRLPAGRWEFYIPAKGPVDLDPDLAEIDPDWEQHIQRLTRG